jgi:MoaA/NifB/PqqE/SkfB family radical SAM enzyme
MLLDDEKVEKLAGYRNIVPVLSIEGFQGNTDVRRGEGVLGSILEAAGKLKEKDIFWGTSITFTSENLEEVASDEFVKKASEFGCKLFIFVEYVPVDEGTEHLVPNDDQREILRSSIERWTDEQKGLFISFPDDEEALGGCISSGRGFVHINSSGDLEPCPFAPYSDCNLKDMSLKDALGSKLLATIRENGERLEETSGGCALWRERDWVRGLLD